MSQLCLKSLNTNKYVIYFVEFDHSATPTGLNQVQFCNSFLFFPYRRMNLDQLRLCHLPDAPTLFPIPDWSPEPKSYMPVEFDKLVDPEKRFHKRYFVHFVYFVINLIVLKLKHLH